MPEWSDRHIEEILRAFFLVRGVPRETERLEQPYRRVAEQLVEERGAAAFIGIAATSNVRMAEQLVIMAERLDRAAGDGEITEASAGELDRTIRRELARFSAVTEVIATSGVEESIGVTREAHIAALQLAFALAGVSGVETALEGFDDFRDQAIRSAAVRAGFREPVGVVIRRHIVAAAEAMAANVRAQTGHSAREVVRTMIAQIIQDDRVAHEIMQSFGGRRAALGRAIGRLRAGINRSTVQGKMLLNIRRNLINGINGMHHEALVLGYAKSPMVKALRWKNSPGHLAGQWAPDICSIVARIDAHQLGPGVYYPETCPSLLHPDCECRVEPIYRDPSEWSRPKDRPATPGDLSVSEASAILRRLSVDGSPTLTRRRLSKQIGMANVRIHRAHQEWLRAQRTG